MHVPRFVTYGYTPTVVGSKGPAFIKPDQLYLWIKDHVSLEQGSSRKISVVSNFAPTVRTFCDMREGQALAHVKNFCNCSGKILDRRILFNWFLIQGSNWSSLIKMGSGHCRLLINEACHLMAIAGTTFLVPSHLCQVIIPHLKKAYSKISSIGTRSLNEL